MLKRIAAFVKSLGVLPPVEGAKEPTPSRQEIKAMAKVLRTSRGNRPAAGAGRGGGGENPATQTRPRTQRVSKVMAKALRTSYRIGPVLDTVREQWEENGPEHELGEGAADYVSPVSDDVSFIYRDSQGLETERRVIVHRASDKHFYGYCLLRQSNRTFIFSRIVGKVTRMETGEILSRVKWQRGLVDND